LSISDNANQKILTRLQRQLDPAIIEYLNDPYATLIQNRLMTIVFWDISNFSKLTEVFKDHPELIAVFLNEYLGVAVPIIHEYGGIIDKFIGDGILAYFGFKESDVDGSIGASNAILTALKLKKSFQIFKQNWLDLWKTVTNFDITIDIKCGINTGSVLVGLMGSEERDQFTVIGTHVNLASRLEGIAESDQIVISQYTKEKILEKFNLKTIQIKQEKIKAFEDIMEYYIVIGQN
jgi:class 3 adenylate cyclase